MSSGDLGAIVDVLKMHRGSCPCNGAQPVTWCKCGWHNSQGGHDAHVAAAIAEALPTAVTP